MGTKNTPPTPFVDDARWNAIAARDGRAGSFLFGVTSTGIYCRPGCASRLPRRDRVRYFEDAASAEAASFRACKRCAPNATHDPAWASVKRALEALEVSEPTPSLEELASVAGFSRAQFHRTFVRLLGITPKRYAALARPERLRLRAQRNDSERLLDAALASGYTASTSAPAERARLGMTPRGLRERGRGYDVRVASGSTELGFVAVAMTERGVCAVELDDDEAAARARIVARYPAASFRSDAELDRVLGALIASIDTPGSAARIPLDVAGTAFQRRVWDELARISSGSTRSYGEVAVSVGLPGGSRAVARACATNPVALAIPCHRVVRGDGGLGGYRWGIERKRRLIERERSAG